MTWIKLGEEFVDHPKVARLGDVGPLAGWQFVCILSYCNRYLTDGHIPSSKAMGLVAWHGLGLLPGGLAGKVAQPDGELICELLIDAGLLEDCADHDDCLVVHDFLDYQPSRAEVEKERAQTRERVERHRKRNPSRNGVGNGVTNGGVTGASVSVPVPVSRGYISPPVVPPTRGGEPEHISALLRVSA